MIKAIVKNGLIVPIDPLPADWNEGTAVQAEKQPDEAPCEIHPADAWMDEVERYAAMQDPDDDLRLQNAIDEERRIQKEMARRGML